MGSTFVRSVLAVWCLAHTAGLAAADVLALQAVRDNTLYEDPNGSLSSGKGVALFAGRTRGFNGMLRKRGLIAFDVAGSVPAGATIHSVTLTLYMAKTSAPAADVSLHRVTQAWGEGTSTGFGGGGASATSGDATWLHSFSPASFWTTPGGDYDPAASAVESVGGQGFYAWSSASLTADVQDMLADPTRDHGWLILGDESGATTVKLFTTREAFSVGQRPVLTIDFSPPRGSVTYCSAGTSASGCHAAISASGSASATAPSGFHLSATGLEGQKDGLFFFGTNGRQANPWGNGTSFQCVVPPVKRGGILAGRGTSLSCDGAFSQDLNALWCPSCPKPLHNPGPGALVQAQAWYRDPSSTSNQTTSLSDAIEFSVGP